MYLALRPKPPLLRAIGESVARCRCADESGGVDGGGYVAVHIRRTDYTTTFGESTPDRAFDLFLDLHGHLVLLFLGFHDHLYLHFLETFRCF